MNILERTLSEGFEPESASELDSLVRSLPTEDDLANAAAEVHDKISEIKSYNDSLAARQSELSLSVDALEEELTAESKKFVSGEPNTALETYRGLGEAHAFLSIFNRGAIKRSTDDLNEQLKDIEADRKTLNALHQYSSTLQELLQFTLAHESNRHTKLDDSLATSLMSLSGAVGRMDRAKITIRILKMMLNKQGNWTNLCAYRDGSVSEVFP